MIGTLLESLLMSDVTGTVSFHGQWLKTERREQSDLTSVSQVRLTLPFKAPLALLSTLRLHLKPGGAKGAALFGVLIFCLLPLLIGPCSGWSAEISPVTSYNSPLPAAESNGAGH